MRWVCPRCRSAVSVAFSECPYCAPEAPPTEVPTGPPFTTAEASPAATEAQQPDASALRPAPAVAAPPVPERAEARSAAAARSIRQAFQRPDAGLEELADEELSLFRRGLEMGVGFMLAVVIILFLLSLLFFWLSVEPGWRPWWERLVGSG